MKGHIGHLGQPGAGESRFHRLLVHADGRAENTGAHKGLAGQLEQPLNRSVLAIGTMQHRVPEVDRITSLREPLES